MAYALTVERLDILVIYVGTNSVLDVGGLDMYNPGVVPGRIFWGTPCE